jgi:hypothetical protein
MEESSELHSKDLYGTETWVLRKVDMKHPEGFETLC